MQFSFSFPAMGSTFSIRMDFHHNTDAAQACLQATRRALISEVEALEQMMSRFRQDSELTMLNQRVEQPVQVSIRFAEVLQLADRMYRETDGVFDPRVLAAMEAIDYQGADLGHVPMDVSAALGDSRGPFEWMDDGCVRIHYPIDLGGIGKGFAADVLAHQIEQEWLGQGLVGYIVNAGGDLVIGGVQETGEPWVIGVENPQQPDGLIAAISPITRSNSPKGLSPDHDTLSPTAICTSSVWKRSWKVDNHQVHHLIQPKTGKPANTDFLSVTVVGRSAAITEVFAKSILIGGKPLDPDGGEEEIGYLIATRAGSLLCPERMRSVIVWHSAHTTHLDDLRT
jgi:thiamine biosynthesis lipoprotein